MTRHVEDWLELFELTALQSGWTLVDSDRRGFSSVEIHGATPEITDENAVRRFKQDFDAKLDHAIQGYYILKDISPGEFSHWDMDNWSK